MGRYGSAGDTKLSASSVLEMHFTCIIDTRHYTTSRKVAGSNPDEVDSFN
jgi:hypothetical protein